MDPLVSDHILQRICQHEKDTVIPLLMKKSHLTLEEAEVLFRFLLHGSFAVNRSLNWQKDTHWYQCQNLLERFICGGMKEV